MAGPIKVGLTQLKKLRPQIKTILMGSRATDPEVRMNSKCQKTDDDWPSYMRQVFYVRKIREYTPLKLIASFSMTT